MGRHSHHSVCTVPTAAMLEVHYSVYCSSVTSETVLRMLDHTLGIPPTWHCRFTLSSVASLSRHVFFCLHDRSMQLSSWALILLTAERLISVWMPFKCKELCSRRRIVIAWTVISLLEDDHSGIPSFHSRSRSSPCCCLAPTCTSSSRSTSRSSLAVMVSPL